MKEIPLTQGKVALVDDEDFEWVNQWKWCVKKDPKTYYAIRTDTKNGKRKTLLMHREILKAPQGFFTDHRDGNGLNNQKKNLRLCTNAQNQYNRKASINNTSGYKGAYWFKTRKLWRATIRIQNKTISLGYFKTLEEAALAYDKAAMKYHGEFAKLNFPRKAAS